MKKKGRNAFQFFGAFVRPSLARHFQVLLLGPIGLLVTSHRQQIPPDADITVETVHSSFKISRDADQQYLPPGRLRHYDLIIFDEVSQVDAKVWSRLQTAFREMCSLPYIVFVGDFQQLQPVTGLHQLQRDLDSRVAAGEVERIQLQQHAAARSADPDMLAFLQHCRTRQPPRDTLTHFFDNRIWSKDVGRAVQKARELESRTGKSFTFLTVTNKGAAAINKEWVRQSFPAAAASLAAGGGHLGDPAYGEERLCFQVGMRVRLTHNLDKDRGFVNGATGHIHHMLGSNVFVLKTMAGVLLLVHPIWQKGHAFMPVTYAYATTVRRAQGATLQLVGIRFDRKVADEGYAYVAASRAKTRADVYLVGSVRRTDWRPVGGDDRGQGCATLSACSMSDSEGPESEEPSTEMSSDDPASEEEPSMAMDASEESSQQDAWGSSCEDGSQEELEVEEGSSTSGCRNGSPAHSRDVTATDVSSLFDT